MFYSYKIKQAYQSLLATDFFQKLFCFNDTSVGTILMLHRIGRMDDNRIQSNEHLKISPEFLESIILESKKRGFRFVSIDELYDVLRLKKKASKLMVVTLDDGYRDNITVGLPIFKKYSVPFTIYVSTGMIEKEFIFWNCLLEDIILDNDKVILADGSMYKCKSKRSKEKAFMAIRKKIIKIHPKNIKQELPKMLFNYNVDLYKYSNILPMTWEQLKILANEPLATIGSHTHSHIGLNFHSEEENILDIKRANHLFKEKVNIIPKHFCYPYGGVASAKERDIIAAMDFKTAVTTDLGNIYPEHATNLLRLPRIFVAEKSNPDLFGQMIWLKYNNK